MNIFEGIAKSSHADGPPPRRTFVRPFRMRKWLFAVALVSLCCESWTSGGQQIPGIDVVIRKTPAGRAQVALGQGGLPGIPANFFGPGSLPFSGELDSDFGQVLLNRPVLVDFDQQNPATTPYHLDRLLVTAELPIQPLPGHSYDVFMDFHGPGTMVLRQDDSNGGRVLGAGFNVDYKIQFLPFNSTPGGTRTLSGSIPLQLAATVPALGIPWTRTLQSGALPPSGTNLVLGGLPCCSPPGVPTVEEFFLQSSDGLFSLSLSAAVPEPSSVLCLAAIVAALAVARRNPRATCLCVCLVVLPGRSDMASAAPVTIQNWIPISQPRCNDPLFAIPPVVEELGTNLPVAFPPFTAADSIGVRSFNGDTEDRCVPGQGRSFGLEITNQTNRTYSDVWYVGDSGTQISVYDGIIDFGRAFRIDRTGFFRPLLNEIGGVRDGLFQPGEKWFVAVEGYSNSSGLPITALTSAGTIGNTPPGFSSGSIIAVAIPEPTGFFAALIGSSALSNLIRRRLPHTRRLCSEAC